MRRIALFMFLMLPVISYAQHRTQISYDVPTSKAVSWNNDSIAPFKVAGTILQADQIFELPGKSKDEIYNVVADYFTRKYSHIQDMTKDFDRNAGRISMAFLIVHDETYHNMNNRYRMSMSWVAYVKDGKLRLICSLNHLILGKIDVSSLFGKGELMMMVDKDVAECYPIVPPKYRKPNRWEDWSKEIIRTHIEETKAISSEIVEFCNRESDDW